MNYITIFDVSKQAYNWFPVLVSASFVLMGVLIVLFAPRLSKIVTSVYFKSVIAMRLFGLFLTLFSLFWAFITYRSTNSEYNFYREMAASGKCILLEGRVELFSPMPRDGSGFESFYVGGIYFAYADSINPGTFNITSLRGGPIREGLSVRICYIRTTSGPTLTENKILRLEINK